MDGALMQRRGPASPQRAINQVSEQLDLNTIDHRDLQLFAEWIERGLEGWKHRQRRRAEGLAGQVRP